MASYRIIASLKEIKIEISSSPSSLSVEDLFSLTPILIFAALVGALQFKPCTPLCALEVAPGTWFGRMFWLHQRVSHSSFRRWNLTCLLCVKEGWGARGGDKLLPVCEHCNLEGLCSTWVNGLWLCLPGNHP